MRKAAEAELSGVSRGLANIALDVRVRVTGITWRAYLTRLRQLRGEGICSWFLWEERYLSNLAMFRIILVLRDPSLKYRI